MIVDVNGDVIRKTIVKDGVATVQTIQDVEPYLESNHQLRSERSEHQKYKGNMVKAASIPSAVIEQMANGQCCPDRKKYKLMSPDMEERRRALVHIQHCHKDLLTVNGKPFAKKRAVWE